MGRRPQVTLLTNMPAPYRLPVFEALAESVDLRVLFCRRRDPSRLWQLDTSSDRVQYQFLQGRSFRFPGAPQFTWNFGLWHQLRRSPADVYIVGENISTLPAVLTILAAALRWKKPLVMWSEAIDTPYASGHPLSDAYRRFLYRRTDAFIAYSRRAKAYLERRGVPPNHITLGFQVVPSQQLPPPSADKRLLGLSGKRVVLYVGYFVARKGLADLIAAFQEVATSSDILALVGGGPDEVRLRALSQHDQRIIFPGYLEGAEKTSWYEAADLFVLPTLHDPWGLVVNEAMAFGLPLIVTDAAGCTDLIRENGLVVRAGDPYSLAAALRRLLSDAALRQEMGQRSQAIISEYTVERASDAFVKAIDRVLSPQHGRN